MGSGKYDFDWHGQDPLADEDGRYSWEEYEWRSPHSGEPLNGFEIFIQKAIAVIIVLVLAAAGVCS